MMNMDLSRIMDTYRGHEDRLKKRVELSNDLLELIAYEQLTREKRQLIAAQQAKSMPPGGMPTIKEQKEDEAFDLTKQELAQQIGKTLQQKAAQQGRPPMMAGVAAAPGAQNVMPPQAMAAGGIVAFNGEDGSDVRAYSIDERRKPVFIPQGRSMRRLLERAAERQAELEQAQREAAPEAQFGVGARPPSAPPPEEALGANVPPARETGPRVDLGSQNEAPDAPRVTVPQSTGPQTSAAPADSDSRVASPTPPASGIAALLQENPNLMNQLQGIFAENTVAARNKRDTPQLDEVAKLRKQIAELKYPTTPPEITRARQEDQQKLEEYYQRMNDPEAQRIKNLTAFLLGGAGRRGIGSVLGGAGEASARSAAAQEAAGLQALKDMQAGRESLRGAQLQEQQAIFQSNLKKAELGGNIAKVAAEIEAQLNIKDQDVNRALAETALRSLTTYGSDLNKIAADIQKEAAERGVRMSTNEATNLTQIIVARIQAGGAESRAKEKEISDLVTEEAKLRERLIDNRNKEIEKNIGLGSALNKAPDKRSVAEQRLVDEFESRMQNDKTLLKGIQDRLAELRGRPTPSASAGSTGSASSQGVKVTGASAPR